MYALSAKHEQAFLWSILGHRYMRFIFTAFIYPPKRYIFGGEITLSPFLSFSAMRWFILCLRKYVDFKGRARRKEFWLFTLFYLIALVIPPAVIIPIAVIYRHTIDIALCIRICVVVEILVIFSLLLPAYAVTVRRLHDTNRSGLWVIASIVPRVLAEGLGVIFGQKWLIQIAEGEFPTLLLINMFLLLIDLCVSILILVMMCERGTEGENRFGPDPLSDGREVLMEPEPGK